MTKPLHLFCLTAACLIGGLVSANTASAQGPGMGFLPFGFYQPYGAQYGTSIRTPPYFATNPPVYYGQRYARPYGISPFAAPPAVSAPASYTAQPATAFVAPPVMNPYTSPGCSDCLGEIKRNPYVSEPDRVATY